jgi:ABC-type transporter MlaC component
MTNAESGDVSGMMQLFAKKAIQEKGQETVRSNNQAFADLVERVRGQGKTLKIEGLKESVNGETANVSFFYGDREKNDSAHLNFSLVKENGEWKVYDVGPAQ